MLANNLHIDAYYPNNVTSLYIRGNGCGLNWTTGVKMTKTGDTKYSVDLPCPVLTEKLEAKVLVGDS